MKSNLLHGERIERQGSGCHQVIFDHKSVPRHFFPSEGSMMMIWRSLGWEFFRGCTAGSPDKAESPRGPALHRPEIAKRRPNKLPIQESSFYGFLLGCRLKSAIKGFRCGRGQRSSPFTPLPLGDLFDLSSLFFSGCISHQYPTSKWRAILGLLPSSLRRA